MSVQMAETHELLTGEELSVHRQATSSLSLREHPSTLWGPCELVSIPGRPAVALYLPALGCS